MITVAKLSQLNQILQLVKACAEKMRGEGIYQWSEDYPSYKIFRRDIERGELFVFSEIQGLDGLEKIVGCIVISEMMDEFYKEIEWITENSKHYYIHRLAVHPEYQGRGIARKMMDFAENLGIQNKMVSVRLDTFSKNKRNQKFYEARGYRRLGEVFFPDQSEFPFFCYELPLSAKFIG